MTKKQLQKSIDLTDDAMSSIEYIKTIKEKNKRLGEVYIDLENALTKLKEIYYEVYENENENDNKQYEEVTSEQAKGYIEQGHMILEEKYWDLWEACVPSRLADLYHGMELDCCLGIINPLNNGCPLEEAKKIIEGQNHSGMSFALVCSMVRSFCERGTEFCKYINNIK